MNTPATQTNKRDIRSLIQSDAVKSQMAMVLPKHLTAERMARVACTAILKTPKLANCSPESLLQALMLCSQAGLEPDGRNAHLIPYGDQVQVIFDWKGLVALARRNGVQNISADNVCENDEFEWYRDAEGLHFKHKVNFRKPRGEMFASYCIWKDGDQFDGEVMTKDEIDAIRKRSRAGTSGPWVSDYGEMSKKTVVRRSSKKWPLDAELAEALNDADSNPTVTVSSNDAKPNFALIPPPAEDPANDGDLGPQPAAPKRGRPAGSKNHPTTTNVEAQVTPEPTAPAASAPAKVEEPKTVNYVKGIRGMLHIENISEGDLLEFGRATQGWDDSLSTLEELSMIQPSKLKAIYEDWPNIAKAIKAIVK